MRHHPGQQRRLPFLHRNWAAGVAGFQEWTPPRPRPRPRPTTTTTTTTPTTFHRARPENTDKEANGHPAKRRRVGPLTDDDTAAGSDAADRDRPPLRDPRDALRILRLPDDPVRRPRELRVQVFNVLHKDSPRLRFASSAAASIPAADTTALAARVKVTILTEQCGLPLLMCCYAKVGTVHTYGDGASSPVRHHKSPPARGIARLLVKPFVIPLDEIATVNTNINSFGLANKYRMRIEIESIASNVAAWPPLGILPPPSPAPVAAADQPPRGLTATTGSGHRRSTTDKACKPAKHVNPLLPERPRSELCILYAEARNIFAHPRVRIPLWLRESPQHDPVRTDFVLDVGLRWSTGFVDRPAPTLNLGVLPSIVALHPDEPLPPPGASLPVRHVLPWGRRRRRRHGGGSSRYANGVDDTESAEDDEDAKDAEETEDAEDADGDLQLARSLRERRSQTDYNIRALTDRASGLPESRKQPRVPWDGHRRRRTPAADTAMEDTPNGTAVAAEKVSFVYPPEEVIVNGFVCCMCMAACRDLVQLRAHLLVHWKYHFALQVRPGSSNGGGGDRVRVRSSVSGSSSSEGGESGEGGPNGDGPHGDDPNDSAAGCRYFFSVSRAYGEDADADGSRRRLQPAVFQLGRPTRRLDLARYVDGDVSWVTARYGAQHGKEVVLPVFSKRARGKKGRLLVPHTRQKLFDPLSKALLVPGAVLRQPAVAVDDSWRIHKHREIVQDYTDLTPAEKEFIQEWDRFLIVRRIASDAYIPAALVQFVHEHGAWLTADRARSIEFGKLMAVLLARDVLADDADVDRIAKAMNAARLTAAAAAATSAAAGEQQQQPPTPTPTSAAALPTSPSLRRDPAGCAVCGRRCAGPEMLICSNPDCSRRLYHRSCVAGTAVVATVHRHEWYCNACAQLADPALLVRPGTGGTEDEG